MQMTHDPHVGIDLLSDTRPVSVPEKDAALLGRQPIRAFASFISLDGMSVRSLPICQEELEVCL
jgi:hypothetical protein